MSPNVVHRELVRLAHRKIALQLDLESPTLEVDLQDALRSVCLLLGQLVVLAPMVAEGLPIQFTTPNRSTRHTKVGIIAYIADNHSDVQILN